MWHLFGGSRKGKPSLEEQLKVLTGGGIRLLSSITINHLLSSFDRESYESEPYSLLLTVMGSEAEGAPFTYLSDNIWHFDTECIEGHGAYIAIAQRMSDLAGGALPLVDINDYVDLEEEKAWLSFQLDKQEYRWDAVVEDDWVDSKIISQLADLLKNRNQAKRFTYFDLKGQDCLIGCSTEAQLKDLRGMTALNFQWLT